MKFTNMKRVAFALGAFAAISTAQQACEKDPDYCKAGEKPLEFNIYKCAKGSGCELDGTNYLTMDANWRWTQKMGSWSNCWDRGHWSGSECQSEADQEKCAKSCMLEGVEYKNYGVYTGEAGDSITMTFKGQTGNTGARLYVVENHDPSAAEVGEQWRYKPFDMRNKEITFDVELSGLTCGINGPAYFVEMPLNGDYDGTLNTAGALYGTGYCDAQCPGDVKFVKGRANIPIMEKDPPFTTESAWKNCCAEMDLLEANVISSAVTPHPVAFASNGSTIVGQYICSDARDECKKNSDTAGCDWATYRLQYYNGGKNMGASNVDYWGEGKTVDTTKKMRVVTQFITSDGTDTGDLVEIRRVYEQDGKTIQHMSTTIDGKKYDSLTDEVCTVMANKFEEGNDHFKKHGGMLGMGDAFSRGMTLVLSLWDDSTVNMRWLDGKFPSDATKSTPGATRGTCADDEGPPAEDRNKFKDVTVTYSRVMYGEIGSTYGEDAILPTMVPPTPSPPVPEPDASCTSTVKAWGSCMDTPACCATGMLCYSQSEWYAQCLTQGECSMGPCEILTPGYGSPSAATQAPATPKPATPTPPTPKPATPTPPTPKPATPKPATPTPPTPTPATPTPPTPKPATPTPPSVPAPCVGLACTSSSSCCEGSKCYELTSYIPYGACLKDCVGWSCAMM